MLVIYLPIFINLFCLAICLLMTEQKAKLSEVEMQLKKAEAAQRRRIQSEKAAREAEVCFLFSITFIILDNLRVIV